MRVNESAEVNDNTLEDVSSVDSSAELSAEEYKKDCEFAIGAEETMELGN